MISPDYGKIISRSWELTWKHKWLWVYGLVLAAVGGGGFRFNNFPSTGGGSSSNSSTKNLQDLQKNLPSNLPQQGQKVLGQATNMFTSWLHSVPPGVWVLIVLAIIFLVIFGIAVNMILVNWAQGSLIAGLDMADQNETVGLVATSKKGLASLKKLIVFGLVMGVTILISVLALVLLGIIFIVINQILGVVFLVLAVITLLIEIVLLAMVGVYAERLIVLQNFSPWEAWKKGLSLSKGNFLQTTLMGIINLALGCAVSCGGLLALGIVLGIPGILIALPMFVNGFHFVVGSAVGLGILFFLGIYANLILRAGMVVFNTCNWNLFFKQVTDSNL